MSSEVILTSVATAVAFFFSKWVYLPYYRPPPGAETNTSGKLISLIPLHPLKNIKRT
jgi:hypothetical protein